MKLFFLLLTILCGLATCGLTGCEVLKGKHISSNDSTSVKKGIKTINTDDIGGYVNKNETKSKGEYDRTTYIYKDTNIVNIYPQQPIAVIHETGKNEQTSNSIDSGFYHMVILQMKEFSDSMHSWKENKDKDVQKETKGLGVLVFMLITAGILISYELIRYGFSKFRIIKK